MSDFFTGFRGILCLVEEGSAIRSLGCCDCGVVERTEKRGRNLLVFTFFFSSCFRSGCGLD